VINLLTFRRPDLLGLHAAVSAVTVAELAYGIGTAQTSADALARSRRYAEVKQLFEPLPFDLAAAESYGDLAAAVRDAGRNPRPCRLDLMIGAIAVANKLPLVTASPDYFKGTEALLKLIPAARQVGSEPARHGQSEVAEPGGQPAGGSHQLAVDRD
jgi:predicted nucleic acid-binding protein